MRFRLRVIALLSMSLLSANATDSDWRTVYDGLGQVRLEGEAGIILSPKAPGHANETHSALVLARSTEIHPVKNFKISFRYQIRQQLRRPASAAQPWETLWLFFNYRPDGQFKKTNYLLIKENGIEIGRAWGDAHQKFLYTALEPRLTGFSTWHFLTVIRREDRLSVKFDGTPTQEIQFSSGDLYSATGALGFYSEDADVQITDVQYQSDPP